MTPDELAMHLTAIAREHGATLTDITFQTFTETATGTHSYSAVTVQRLTNWLPETVTMQPSDGIP